MEFLIRQSRLERRTYQAINDLENEFDVDLPDYPEIRWLGRCGNFEDLGLPERYRESVEASQKNGGSIFLYRPNVIVLNQDNPHHIHEEATHCLNLRTTGITFYDKTREDWFAVNVLIEMLGYLGSKILDPSRHNMYSKHPDYLSLSLQDKKGFKDAMVSLNDLDDESISETLIHSQGYGLAERVFWELETGSLPIKKLQDLIRRDFRDKGQATRTLMQLRREVWPIGT